MEGKTFGIFDKDTRAVFSAGAWNDKGCFQKCHEYLYQIFQRSNYKV